MYIEMIDETNQVSEEIKNQTLDILEFAAQKTGKEDKEMAVTFVTNERSHELNLKYRDTNRPTDVISLEYKPESSLSFDEEDLSDDPDLAEVLTEFDAYIGASIGGISLTGGKGKLIGALFGSIFLTTFFNGMTMLNVDPFWQDVLKGVVLIAAIGLDAFRNRKTH